MTEIARHKTAIRRPGLSLPVKCLLRDGLLDGSRSLFDYGCGYGQDVELLAGMGVDGAGWDPAHRPEGEIRRADVVNLGYVINVIEDPAERADVLRRAWDLADQVLAVSALGYENTPASSEICEHGPPGGETIEQSGGRQMALNDGVLTSRGTFQKRYSHQELRAYLERLLPADAVPAAPNVYYLFKDEEVRQQYLASRFRRALAVPRVRVSEQLYNSNQDVLAPFMAALTRLGRLPGPEELPEHPEILARFGSLKRAFFIVGRATGQAPWVEIATRRKEDLLVYLALARFGRRTPLSLLPLATQRDIKAFAGTYARAREEADRLLYSVGRAEEIDAACQRAETGCLVENARIVRRDALDTLEPILRVYEGCARAIAGDIEGANVIKLHRFSGKVTYLVCEDPDTDPNPAVRLRVKVDLPHLDVRFFDYDSGDLPRLNSDLRAATGVRTSTQHHP